MAHEDIEDYRAEIATRVRAKRTALAWSQSKLVTKTGIPQTTISSIECRGKPFSLTVAYTLAHVFECPVYDLLPENSADVEQLLVEKLS